jgi:hypothetical protein
MSKLKTPLLDSMAKENKQKAFEINHLMKKALWQYHEDVLNPDYPSIVLTPQCEAGYIQGFLAGSIEGFDMANKINKEVFAPTLNSQEGIADDANHELLN